MLFDERSEEGAGTRLERPGRSARPGPGPGERESLFSSKRLLEPIEGLIVVDIVSWQTVAFGIKVSDGERNDPRNVGHVEMSRLL